VLQWIELLLGGARGAGQLHILHKQGKDRPSMLNQSHHLVLQSTAYLFIS
jgi:hypothetical protein